MAATDKIREALEKARRLQADKTVSSQQMYDGVAMFIDEAMSWLAQLEWELEMQASRNRPVVVAPRVLVNGL